MRDKQFDKYQGKKKKPHADLYEQFIDRDRAITYDSYYKAKEVKKKPLEWTPEDQALEDILWAS